MKINILPSEIANMIAAGEVVERPASVVKELVENSVDAGARSITVEIKKGGITYIRVTDDGSGIDGDEIETAFFRHATSKIRTAADLEGINTLGFRGEALASIAAVARVEVFSKTKQNPIGRCAVTEGGVILENEEAGCADGTTMIVRNLFYNTPARMKFLKNDATETGYITDVVTKLILSHPEIAVSYINNGRCVLSSSGDGELLSAIYTVFGRDYTKNMTRVDYSDGSMRVTGYIGNARLARKDRRHQIFFLNSRNITCKIMSAAVSEAYKSTVMTGRFPVCMLNTEIDPHLVDVNVHPAKTEVRFSEEKRVYSLVYWAVKNALTEKKYIPEMEISKKGSSAPATGSLIKNAPSYDGAKQLEINLLKDAYVKDTPRPAEHKAPDVARGAQDGSLCSDKSKPGAGEKTPPSALFYTAPPVYGAASAMREDDGQIDEKNLSRLNISSGKKPADVLKEKIVQNADRQPDMDKYACHTEATPVKEGVDFAFIGQVFGTYMIIQRGDEIMFIDQHAAHERIYFERLFREFNENVMNSQLLLLPVTMVLTPTENDCVMQSADFFGQLGFEVESFGENSIIIRTAPGTLEEQEIKDCISDIISLILENNNNIARQMSEEALHIIACKAALKGNHVLSEREMKSLCEDVLSFTDGINTCPHGRPIMIKMSRYSLEKQFKRIV